MKKEVSSFTIGGCEDEKERVNFIPYFKIDCWIGEKIIRIILSMRLNVVGTIF